MSKKVKVILNKHLGKRKRKPVSIIVRIKNFFRGFLFLIKLVVFLSLIYVVAFSFYKFCYVSDFFTVKEIEIVGVSDKLKNQINKVIDKDSLLKENLLKVDVKKIKGDLKSIPKLDEIQAHKIYPNKIEIVAKELTPIAVIVGENLYTIDDRGLVIDLFDKSQKANMPFITGINDNNIEFGKRLELSSLDNIIGLIKCLQLKNKEFLKEISEFHIQKNNSVSMILVGGVEVKLGEDGFIDKIALLLSDELKEKLAKEKNLKYVDLRFTDQIYYKTL